MRPWTDRVLPRLLDVTLSGEAADRYRGMACAGLSGRVVELGFGSGLNLTHLPVGVTEVLVVEPSDVAWRAAQQRIRAWNGGAVRRVGRDAAAIDLPDGSVDAVLSTWTLCTIPDVEESLREVCRVLRPGGRLHLVEHGLAPQPEVARWQRRLEPLQERLAGGCHLDRCIPGLLVAAGFDTSGLEQHYAVRWAVARPWSWFTVGGVGLAD